MTPQELKSSILQLSIQGKLVEQRPEEGTGEELYQQIQAEKQRLIQAGKIKKEKPLPEIAEDEMLFEIPESWKWVQIRDIAIKITDGTHHSPANYEQGKYRYVTAKNIKNQGVTLTNITYVSEDVHNEIFARCNPEHGDVLLIKDGATTGVVTVNNLIEPFSMLSSVALLKMPSLMSAWYLVYVLRSDLLYKAVRAQMKGTGITRITLKQIELMTIPLPPLAEQKRIVAQIEELLPYLDRYEKAWNRLEEFNRRFPADMQKSILQMAIQGKLVEQRPEEGTGEELYRQIQAEKQALIKAGKIKKEKPLPEIAEDEVPFEIPEGWKWCRLLGLCSLIGDIDHNMPKSVDKNHGVLFLSAKDLLDDGSINYIDNVKYISNEDYDRLSRKVKPQLGDIVYSRIGACLGKARTVKSEVKFLVSYSCCIIRSIQIDVDYLRYYLESPIILAHSVKARQSIGVPDLGMGEIKKYFIALPPLAEQKRIVERLEELLPVCERLK